MVEPALSEPLAELDGIILEQAERIEEFLAYHRNQVMCPVYTSVDIRRNRVKAAVVDTNAFPAGFNNLAARSHGEAAAALESYLHKVYPGAKELLLLAENHTRNAWYFENVATLRDLLAKAGYDVTVGTLNEELFPQAMVETATGRSLEIHGVAREGDEVIAGGIVPDFVVLNNDLSTGSPAILDGLAQPVTPPPSMGWHRRRKSQHFDFVNDLAEQLGAYAGFDPWCVSAYHERVDGVDFRARAGLDEVAAAVDRIAGRMEQKYADYDFDRNPRVFVKADAGTYGMGVTSAGSGEEFLSLNSKGRAKMAKGKEGVATSSVIVQEGVPTSLRTGAQGGPAVAEPVMYMVCGRVVGGFNRVHAAKNDEESLNAPGSTFEPLAFATTEGAPGPDEAAVDPVSRHLYQMVGEIASIATGYEWRAQQEAGLVLPRYP